MRTASLIVSTALLPALLAGCSNQAEPRAEAPSPRAAATEGSAVPSRSPSPTVPAVRLTGDGIETVSRVMLFGDGIDQVEPLLLNIFGTPTKDTGEVPNEGAYGACPGRTQRALEFGDGALRVLFGDAAGTGITLYHWSLVDTGDVDQMPRASALVGDTATFEFGVGDTLAELREGSQGAELEVMTTDTDDADTVFTLTDQSSGFSGFLTGSGEQDTVSLVQAGEACGE